jgi:hypothetical protein
MSKESDDFLARCKCHLCHATFTEVSSLNRHLKNGTCKRPKVSKRNLEDRVTTLMANEALILERLSKIESQPSNLVNSHTQNINHNMNVLCLGSNDNLLDMLESSEGLHLALTYVKDCALARLAGDCRILEKAYLLETERAAIMYATKSKNKYVYYDERRKRTVESNAKVMAKKLAGILQRSYLKSMECFKTDLSGHEKEDQSTALVPVVEKLNLEGKIKKGKVKLVVKHPNPNQTTLPSIEPYDLQLLNEHVHELNDEKYQKKLLNSLRIPIEPGRE